jgi:hypothetical protein
MWSGPQIAGENNPGAIFLRLFSRFIMMLIVGFIRDRVAQAPRRIARLSGGACYANLGGVLKGLPGQ